MGRYLLLWKVDPTKVPVNPKERAAAWKPLIDAVKRDMEKGIMKDWGTFVGELKGYAVVEGTVLEIQTTLQQYIPYVLFEVHPIGSLEQMEELIKVLST